MKHVTNTWLFANGLHPVIFCLYQIVREGNTEIGIFPSVFVLGLLFSIPAYCFCIAAFYAIKRLGLNTTFSFVLWLLAGLAAFIISVGLAKSYFDWDNGSLVSFAPALFASVIAALLRFPFFEVAILSKKADHESHLV
ncbi:MAG: hypothetical protein JWP88_757 [Flaviaesturariibacter sp.]|nr:hypothetical protein [Flaviaesturariibacter sp.]